MDIMLCMNVYRKVFYYDNCLQFVVTVLLFKKRSVFILSF